jgi:predicted transcriptional regulator
MLAFVTELTARPATSLFIGRYGSEKYYENNGALMVDSRRKQLREQADEVSAAAEAAAVASYEAGVQASDDDMAVLRIEDGMVYTTPRRGSEAARAKSAAPSRTPSPWSRRTRTA